MRDPVVGVPGLDSGIGVGRMAGGEREGCLDAVVGGGRDSGVLDG